MEKILIVSDSISGPTGFATQHRGLAWALAKEFDVYSLGLQTLQEREARIVINNEERIVTELPNLPRTGERYDFGQRSLPIWLERIKPDLLITTNDIQMISHIPQILCPDKIELKVIDLPLKKPISKETLQMQLEGELQKFREKYPLDTRWLLYSPQDGVPAMPSWGFYYRFADQVVAMSKFGQNVFRQYFGMDVPYIYHGVDTSVFFPNRWKPPQLEGKFIIGDLNRNQPRKQPVRLIWAFSKFAKGKDDVLLHLQMDWRDPFGHPLDYFVNLYGIQNKIIRPRPVGMPIQDVAKTYNMWDVHACATGGEGFGLCIAESMGCGTPPIYTDYTTCRELIIEGEPSPRGQVVPWSTLHWDRMDVAASMRSLIDIDRMVDAFELYYYDRELLEKHGENGARWVKKHLDWNKLQYEWIDIVRKTLDKDD